jgi:hypothetical protein
MAMEFSAFTIHLDIQHATLSRSRLDSLIPMGDTLPTLVISIPGYAPAVRLLV